MYKPSWPNQVCSGFHSPKTPPELSASLGDVGFPSPTERRHKLDGRPGDLIFRTDWRTNAFTGADAAHAKRIHFEYLEECPTKQLWRNATWLVFNLLHEKMRSRGLRIQSLLLLKFGYEEDGDDTGIPTAFIGSSLRGRLMTLSPA